MRILSLNAWGGKLHSPLMKYLADVDADVLCLQEVESRAALESFRDTWLRDLGYAHVASLDAGDERGIEQSVLSRHEIASAEKLSNSSSPRGPPSIVYA